MPEARVPDLDRQAARIGPMLHELDRVFAARHATLLQTPVGIVPEQVLVLETVGSVEDFVVAVKHTPGLEWLAEWEIDSIAPDEDFYYEDDRDKALVGRLFLVMSNQDALREMQRLWIIHSRHLRDPSVKFPRGSAKWRDLFVHLHNIRPWGAQDRLQETGILEDWLKRVEEGQERLRCEIELWYRSGELASQAAERKISELVRAVQGSVISSTRIPEIAYHGVLVELPINEVDSILQDANTQLVQADQVMFFRPLGQCSVSAYEEEFGHSGTSLGTQPAQGEPVAALLDGLPIENHEALSGHLIVDDPDGFSEGYSAQDRQHGTSMASVIIRGDLQNREEPLSRPLYVRPLLKPGPQDFHGRRVEEFPEDTLPLDLVHRAVRRLFEGEGDQGPVAPHVQLINLSLADSSRPFERTTSPWARLLDWLSWRYKVLILVSAGNHPSDLILGPGDYDELQPREKAVLTAIAEDVRNRRLLSPAESVNALTVGAIHADGSPSTIPEEDMGTRIDPLRGVEFPSPVSSVGLGYRRAVKPDVLFQGGRQLYVRRPSESVLRVSNVTGRIPGIAVASPGTSPGDLSAIRYTCGTSNATALATRAGVLIHEKLFSLRDEPGGERLDPDLFPVLTKTLLVHGATWGASYEAFALALRNSGNSKRFREFASRFYGYGVAEIERSLRCEDWRATLIGTDRISEDDGHVYAVPLPPSLSGSTVWRRIIITLGWFSPMVPGSRRYRKAALWFEPPETELAVKRCEADWQAVQRGTVQHEVLDGTRATAFVDGDLIRIQVNCRAEIGAMRDSIPYGIAVTLEVREGIEIPIYEDIRARIRPAVRVEP